MTPPNRILTINGGSSSIKFTLFETGDLLQRILEGSLERIGLSDARFSVKTLDQAESFSRTVQATNHAAAAEILMNWIEKRMERNMPTAVGHRVVHGGPNYGRPQRITVEMIEELRRLIPFDPDHLPEEILLTEAFHRAAMKPKACAGTAFMVCHICFCSMNCPALQDRNLRKAGLCSLTSAMAQASLPRAMANQWTRAWLSPRLPACR
jgi:acetate kinase